MNEATIVPTKFKDLVLIKYNKNHDIRGGFSKIFDQDLQKKLNIKKLHQVNLSYNIKKGTLRGFHYQKYPFQEEKIIKCLSGRIFDVVIDLRKNSKTFMNYFSTKLNSGNKMLFIPRGFAHAFQTLEDNTTIMYLHGNKYNPKYQNGIVYNSNEFNIKWPINKKIISLRDRRLPIKYEV
jgi:dTDP-4-dehydrorhamnose 3,5-epimerase